MGFVNKIPIALLYLIAFTMWSSEMCRCGHGSYCRLFQDGEEQEDCFCELSEGLYKTEEGSGNGCSNFQDHCLSNPCHNGGSCVPTFGSYNCICNEQHFGQACQLDKNNMNVTDPAKNIMAFFDVHEQLVNGSIKFHVVAEEIGSDFSLVLDDSNGLTRTEEDITFEMLDPHDLCRSIMTNSSLSDTRICQFLQPGRKMYVGTSELKYPVVKSEHKNIRRNKKSNQTIGRLDKVLLSVSSQGNQVFSSSYTLFTYFTADSAACTPIVNLQQCSMDKDKAVTYSKSSRILLRAVSEPALREYPCTYITEVKHIWKVIGKNFQKTFNGESVLRLDGNSLNFGTYMVEYTIDLFGATEVGLKKKHYVNFERCWFKLEAKPAVAVIKGGKYRTYPKETAIDMMAYDSYNPNTGDNSGLSFLWSCDNPRMTFCSAVDATTTNSSFRVKRLRRTITFMLKVWLPELGAEYASETKQIIQIVGTPTSPLILNFYIRCIRNCLFTNPREMTVLEMEDYPEEGEVTWSYSVDGGQYMDLLSILQPGTPHYQAIIPGDSLEYDRLYSIKASYGENINMYELKTMSPPEKGSCRCSPVSGEAGITPFTVECDGYLTALSSWGPLEYMVYEKLPGFSDVLVASSTHSVLKNLQFTSGNIKIRVKNRFGAFVEDALSVQLSSKSSLNLNEVEDLERKISGHLIGWDTSRALSIINFIASMFDSVDGKAELVDRLVTKISEIKLYEISDIKSVAGCLAHLLSKVDGKDLTSRTVKRVSNNLLYISSLINSASANVSNFLQDDLISVSNFILGGLDPLLSSRDPHLSDKFLSSANEYQRSYMNYQLGSKEMLSCLEELGNALLDRMVPHQLPFKIDTNPKIKMETKVFSSETLSAANKTDPSGEGNAWIEFDETFAQLYSGEVIELQVTEFKKSPIWWKETSLSLNTNDLDIKIRLRKPNGSIPVSKLHSPIRVTFQPTDFPSKTITGTVVQPKESLHKFDKDTYVGIHKIDRPKKGNGLIAFDFTGLSEEFDVIMLVNHIPDYDILRQEGIRVNSTNSVYLSEVSAEVEEADLMYLGILPSSKYPGGTNLPYKFNILDSLCRVWSKENWEIGLCKVSTSTGKKIVCECQHLSLFGGSLLVPPIVVHPISDIGLFKSIPSNPYVLILVSVFLLIYCGLLIWADKMDRKDSRERGIIVLQDNFPGDKFGLLLAVFTSERANSGTSANVGIRIIGSKAQSHAHIINHNKSLLQLGQDNWFLIYTDKHLGNIENLHVWHDNTGPHPDWFCSKIMVYDLASDEQYLFLVDRWLTVSTAESEDWKLELTLTPEKERPPGWQSLAKENFFASLRETHIWFSIFVRFRGNLKTWLNNGDRQNGILKSKGYNMGHPRSSYTRRQRLTIGLIIILISMLTSIMFYGAAQEAVEDDPAYGIGVREVLVVLQASAISIVVSVIAGKLFMLSWPDRVYEPPLKANKNPKKKLPWYSPNTIKGCMGKVQDQIGKLILGFLIMDPLLPVQLDAEQPLMAEKKKKKKNAFLVIAWIVNVFIILTCSYFLVLYGLKLGPNKSLIWASVVIFNVGKAIFLTQPLKVIFLSLLVAVFLRMENRDKLTFEVDPVGIDESLKDDPEFMAGFLELRSQAMYHPLAEIDVMIANQTRKNVEKQKWDNITFIFASVIYIFLIIIVLSISANTSPLEINHIMNMVKEKTFNENKTELSDVTNNRKFFQYLIETIIPTLHNTKWYNGAPLPKEKEEEGESNELMKGWVEDYMNKLVGVPRLRQLRVTEGTCTLLSYFKEWFDSCNEMFTLGNLDRNSYGVGWKEEEPYSWSYSSPTQSESLDLYGSSGYYYPGGGYIQNLSHNSWDSIRKLTALNVSKWLDERTRLVVFEFSLFNVHSSIFSIVTLIAENLASGVYTTRVYIDSAFHEFYMQDVDVKLVTVLCFLVVILILSIIRIIIHVSVKGMAVYFSNWGHFLDFLIIFFGFTSIIAAIVRSLYFKTYANIFRRPAIDNIFVSFSYPFYQDDLTSVLICLFIICTTIRLCTLCHYGKYFYVLKKTLLSSGNYIIVVLFLTFVTVSLLAVLMYSCGTQTTVMFPALPVPRARFNNFEDHVFLNRENKLYSIIINYIYLMSGLMMTCVFIYYYGRAKHQLVWYGEGLEYTNRFRYMYESTVKELSAVLSAVKGDKRLRLKGGGSLLREERTGEWDLQTRRLLEREWGHQRLRVDAAVGRDTLEASNTQISHWLKTTTERYERMSQQLDIISQIFDEQTKS